MTCAACATRIGKGLGKLDGVDRADVNLAAARATVVFDPDVVDAAALTAKIESLGYTVPEEDRHAEAEAAYVRVLGRRLLVAAVLTVPTLLISMVPALMFDGWQWVAFALDHARRLLQRLGLPPGRAGQPPPRHRHHGHPRLDGHPRGVDLVDGRPAVPRRRRHRRLGAWAAWRA